MWPIVGAMAAEWLGSEMQGQHNAKEASKQRSWEQMMSNTAFSRAAHDLKSAGLNRVLALGQPASTPAGASSSMDKPNFSGAAIQAASAKQQIAQSRAEERLIGQKQEESASSEALNRAMELTQATQQGLNISNAASANEYAKLLAEQARKTRMEADRIDVLNPFYKIGAEITEKVSQYLRNSAKGTHDVIEDAKKIVNDAKQSVKGASWLLDRPIDTITRKLNEKGGSDVIRDQKWPKFKRGGSR